MNSDIPYEIITLEPDWILDDEPMGTKDKFWIKFPTEDTPWLFKYPRINDGIPTGEHWAEKISAEIARLLHIPHAQVELATMNGVPGSLSKRFDDLSISGVEMVHGNELLWNYVESYDRTKTHGQNKHTVVNIIQSISCCVDFDDHLREEAFRTLCGFAVLDGLVLNTDRHHENWGIIRRISKTEKTGYHIAPSFDHASSLGRELTLNKLELWNGEPWRAAWYAQKGRGGVFLHSRGKYGPNPLALVRILHRKWPGYFTPWLNRLKTIDIDSLLSMVDRIPLECMHPLSNSFARRILQWTYSYLIDLI